MEKAKTSKLPYDLTQIPIDSLKRLGARFSKGEKTYGYDNWKNGVGDKRFQLERANHALAHLLQYTDDLKRGHVDADDHLAAVAWYCVTQMELERLDMAENIWQEIRRRDADASPSNGKLERATEILYDGEGEQPEVFRGSGAGFLAFVDDDEEGVRKAHATIAPQEDDSINFAALPPILQAEIRAGYNPEQPLMAWWFCTHLDGTHVVTNDPTQLSAMYKAELVVDIPR